MTIIAVSIGTIIGWLMCSFFVASKHYDPDESLARFNEGFRKGHMEGYSMAMNYYENKIREMGDE